MVEGKPIYCHQVILASRSVYFEASFSHEFTEKEQRVATYNDVPYDFFMIFLRHIYSDSVKVETKYIYELLSVSYFLEPNFSFSSPTDSVSAHLRRSVSKSWLSTSTLRLFARSSSMQTLSIARDLRRHACSSLRRTTTMSSRVWASKT